MDAERITSDEQERIQTDFDRQGLMPFLGGYLYSAGPGEVRVRLPRRDEVTQQHGYFHGGIIGALADTAGGYAALTMLPGASSVVTVEFKINFLTPAIGDYLEAVGTVLKSGRSISVSRLEVFAVAGETRVLCAVGQQTLFPIARVAEAQFSAE